MPTRRKLMTWGERSINALWIGIIPNGKTIGRYLGKFNELTKRQKHHTTFLVLASLSKKLFHSWKDLQADRNVILLISSFDNPKLIEDILDARKLTSSDANYTGIYILAIPPPLGGGRIFVQIEKQGRIWRRTWKKERKRGKKKKKRKEW